MGCDIHFYKEKFVDGKWLSADEWESDDGYMSVPYEKSFHDRNYSLFGLLCDGVRRSYPFSLVARGLPFDISDQVKNAAEKWDSDGHSHSYLYVHELKSLKRFLESNTIKVTGMKHRDELQKLMDSIATEKPDWNLLYLYCQGTNAPDHEDFEIDVPASFVIGEGLGRMIALFDGVEGENHRAVFWFDN